MFFYVSSLNFIRVIRKKIIVMSLVLVCGFFFCSLHAFTSLPSIFNSQSTLPGGDAVVLGVLLLFVGSIRGGGGNKGLNIFLDPSMLPLDFFFVVQRKAEINLAIFPKDLRLCSHFFHH